MHSDERRHDLFRVESDLGMGETQRHQPSRRVRLVALPVSRLLRGSTVVAETVGLRHQSDLGPVEIDLEPADVDPCLGTRETGAAGEREEAPLELGVREDEGSAVQDPAHGGDARDPRAAVENGTECVRVDQVELVRLIDRCLELTRWQPGAEVDQGSQRRGDGDPVVPGEIFSGKNGPSMDTQAGPAPSSGRDGDFDLARLKAAADAPEGGGALVTEPGVGAGEEDRRHPAAVLRQLRSADGVNAAPDSLAVPHGMQPALPEPVLDGSAAEAQIEQLRPSYDPVLSTRELPNASRNRGLAA